jgi:hypothetical protein
LYTLMSDIIGGAYRAMLQHATATARLAQEQLAFERAETTRTVIATDYWQTPGALFVAGQDTSRGMTGAERLIRDLSQLDQYAFSTDDRLLNISQTFSLAQLFPVEFIDFRSTGQLTFATPMSLFDGDFPGNYQRFIRQVQVSVVALIPPGRGIRGTLRNNGMSRVTSKQDGGGFTDLVLRRDPSSIAITSPLAATGLFPADPQPELLLPFEGIGVDTTWEFELPAAANPFDFTSLSDVLITVDYTARTDPDYATQVIKTLNAHRTRGADCAFSLARDFPDNWYALSNPPAHQAPTTTVLLRDLDFPINIRELSTANVALRVISSTPLDPVIATLTRTVAVRDPSGTVTYITVGGPAQIGPDGIASTRRGAANWPTLLGPTPAGSWTLGFDTTFTNLVTQGQVDDVVLIVSWTGQSALWNN